MESLVTSELFIDNLLDFSSDIGEEDDEDGDNNKTKKSKLNNHTKHPQLTEPNNGLNSEGDNGSFPLIEELEWLANSDAFPSIETSDILCQNKPKNHSPVSVLGIGSGCLYVPVQSRSKRRRRRRSHFSDLSSQQWWSWCEPKKKRVEAIGSSSTSSFGRRCEHCGIEKTPQWRTGPLGPKTLCNACGVRYKSGRLFPEYRPANSPTFSSTLHSNSHRKIMDMRKQKQNMLLEPFDKGT